VVIELPEDAASPGNDAWVVKMEIEE